MKPYSMSTTSSAPPTSRVPQIILLYWVIKIASTTLGETAADMFSMTYDLGYGSTIVLFLAIFLLLLLVKLYQRRYEPVTYWLTFTASAIAGTAISDYIDRVMDLGYAMGSLLLVSILGVILALWYGTERSINVERVHTARVETWYWLAFLIANTLGTAAGDYLADDLGLGFASGALVISTALAVIAAAHLLTRRYATTLFWLAFVLTRPFGATFGDWLTKTHEQGGIDLGTLGASAIFAAILVVAVLREAQLERTGRPIRELD